MEYILILKNLINYEAILWFCALVGSGMMLIQFLLNLFGLGEDHVDEIAIDALKFKWLSRQAISGFVMMFGWTGLACQHEFGLSMMPSILISFAVGVLTIFITTSIFKAAKKLHSSGNVFNIEEAIGKEAFVYQRIPKEGVGKVTISLQNFTHEIDAISLNQEELPSFTRVQIIKKLDNHTVVVTTT